MTSLITIIAKKLNIISRPKDSLTITFFIWNDEEKSDPTDLSDKSFEVNIYRSYGSERLHQFLPNVVNNSFSVSFDHDEDMIKEPAMFRYEVVVVEGDKKAAIIEGLWHFTYEKPSAQSASIDLVNISGKNEVNIILQLAA